MKIFDNFISSTNNLYNYKIILITCYNNKLIRSLLRLLKRKIHQNDFKQ